MVEELRRGIEVFSRFQFLSHGLKLERNLCRLILWFLRDALGEV
jgi:hypothetical protein